MEQQIETFERVPAIIDFFISHPLIAKIFNANMTPMLFIVIMTAIAYFPLGEILRRKHIVRNSLICAAIFVSALCVRWFHDSARKALSPTSTTVIAAIIDGKHAEGFLFTKKYYLLTRIEDKYHAVVTEKSTYDNPRYRVGATFDYSLYTYVEKNRILMYRFLKPRFKVKAEQGNLQ